jgi:acyl-coenzyme A synthetase/AMP-(fatty) acid ligase
MTPTLPSIPSNPTSSYTDFYRRSLEDRDGFWGEQAQLVDWQTPPTQACDYSHPPFARWFVGGTTNLCYNAVDRHLKARAGQAALIAVSSETQTEQVYTFAQLHSEVQRMAAALLELGVQKGDRVLIYMPMIAEAAFAMLVGRTDDVINVAGHRFGTREIEESISGHDNISEVAVVGVADALKGQVAVAFAVVKDASALVDKAACSQLEAQVMKRVDQTIGAVGRPARVHFVTALPKTRSGKLLRRALQAVCEGRDTGDLTTMDDPAALQQIKDLLAK